MKNVTRLIKTSHMLEFQNMNIIHDLKDHIFGLKMTPKAWFNRSL